MPTVIKPIPELSQHQQDVFWSHVEKTDTCWWWTGALSSGYGHWGVVIEGLRHNLRAHRVAFELINERPISLDENGVPLALDHICANAVDDLDAKFAQRACVNPAHLREVTYQENLLASMATVPAQLAARTECIHGHSFTPENTRISPRGTRICRTCDRLTKAALRAQRKAA